MTARKKKSTCVFCDIVNSNAPANVVARFDEALCIVPLKPVVPGHVLVIPHLHVADFIVNPHITSMVAYYASQVARSMRQQCNLITSAGTDATQTVMHLHMHVVPRKKYDGLSLPWTGQK